MRLMCVISPRQIVLVEAATPDVSSTAIRDRARLGLPLEGLVPAPVEAHVGRHGLYLVEPTPPGRPLA